MVDSYEERVCIGMTFAPSLITRIASQLRREIEESDIAVLPPAAQLARRHNVSHVTVLRAARMLRAEGLLEFDRGGKMRVAGRTTDEAAPVPSRRLDRVVEAIKRAIADGNIRQGQSLPKQDVMARDLGAAKRTVSRAYALLERRGIVHRSGRAWIAGTAPSFPTIRTRSQTPVILLVGRKESDWRGLITPRTEAFVRTFSGEAERRGVQILPVSASSTSILYRLEAQGLDEAAKLADRLGDRYIGALSILPITGSPDLPEWLDLLTTRKRRAVLFDRNDEGAGLALPNYCFRVHFCEEAALELCAQHLFDNGHRTVGYAARTSEWENQRKIALRNKFTIRGIELVESCGTEDYGEIIQNLLVNTAVTALVASNDTAARAVFYRLRDRRLVVGRDMSLISFDNSPELLPLPVTTIDFGFDTIGYDAYHLIAGDIPGISFKSRSIAARPRLVLRGSVASR